MPFINFDSGKINYTCDGTGSKKVVFLHGFLGNLSIWDQYVNDLGSDYTILRVDLPGHGKTSTFREIHSMEFMAKCVLAVMNECSIESAHFVGHSMGGYVSMAAARLADEKVQTLTLFNSTATEDSEQKKKDRIRTIRVFDLSPELFVSEAINNLFAPKNLLEHSIEVAELKRIGLETGLEGAAPALRGMAEREDMREFLKNSERPTLYIAGKFDNIIPIESAKSQAVQTSSRLVELECSGHMGFVEEYQLTLKTLVDFWN